MRQSEKNILLMATGLGLSWVQILCKKASGNPLPQK